MKSTSVPIPTSRSTWLIDAKSNLTCGLAGGAGAAGGSTGPEAADGDTPD